MSQYVGTNDKSKVKMVFRDGGGTASQTAPAEGAASASASTESVLPQVATGAVPADACIGLNGVTPPNAEPPSLSRARGRCPA